MSTLVPDHHLPHPQRRIRHITSVQIRNLTPFPARDAIAQTLTQPSRSSMVLPQHAVDDIELGGFRRTRRISSGSLMLSYNHETEEAESTPLTGGTTRQRSASKSSSQTVSGSPSASRRLSSNHRSSFIASRHVVSFTDEDASHVLDSQTPSPLFVIHSQKHLEKIISSRLIETFLTLSPLSSEDDIPSSSALRLPTPSPTSPNTSAVPVIKKFKEAPNRKASPISKADHRKGSSFSSTISHKSASSVSRPSTTPTSPTPRSRAGDRGPSTSKTSFTSPPTPPPESPRAKQSSFSTKTAPSRPSSRGPDVQQDDPAPSLPTPFYISSIHQPSTNPTFSHLDPERDFANWADITSSKLQVVIWGRTEQKETPGGALKGKGKQKADVDTQPVLIDSPTWQILDEWVVDLDEIELCTSDSSKHTLPSNTLLITLSSGETFRVPPVSTRFRLTGVLPSHPTVRPDYNSDSDTGGSKTGDETSDPARDKVAKSLRETRMKKSATYQDLVKLINLQTVIADTQQLLENTIKNCNSLIEGDKYDPSRREISELEEWVKTLRDKQADIRESVKRDSLRLEDKKRELRRRREDLAAARNLHHQRIQEYSDRAKLLVAERERYEKLYSQLPTLRTSLIQLVNFIFPIEPVSPADLLFSILDSPLPVPTSHNDPAPPMSMSAFPNVSEDSVSTALGYVVQVIQLISSYLGQALVYPVTCYGSRSVIKDPISSMAGPRIFPLYSRGVDMYRFEYGVFLLNKNIEMFMSERNLRALDIRHTLPNLKNLLLTLTTGEDMQPTSESKRLSEVSETPLPISSSDAPIEANSPTSSTTPTELPHRKSTPFFSPFTALLRSRYPSSLGRPKIISVEETPEQSEDVEPPASVTLSESVLPPQIKVTADDESKDAPANGEISSDVNVVNRGPFEKPSPTGEIPPTSPLSSEVA